MTSQERFAQDHKMPLAIVRQMVRTAKKCGQWNEHYCNGDPHPEAESHFDKARNSELWGRDVDLMTRVLFDQVQPFGFTGIEYTGLFPTLKRGDQFVEIPY